MPFIHTDRDRVRSFTSPVDIDWSHPLADRLNAVYLFNVEGGAISFDLTGKAPVATQVQGQPDSGFTVHNDRRCIRQAASGSEDADYVLLPVPILNDQDDPDYGNSVSLGAAHTHFRAAQSMLLGGTANYSGGWNITASDTPSMGCSINSGNGFGVRDLSVSGFNSDYWTTGKWFDLTLACRYFAGEGKHRLYANFNQDPEEADDETYNNPNGNWHTQHRLFRRDYDNHYYWGGYCSHAYFWDRRFLTENERLWINAEPWAFLRPARTRTWFLPSGPAGGPSAAPWFFHHHILRHRRGA